MPLKLYEYDMGWAGGIVIVANSPEEAVDILLTEHSDHMDRNEYTREELIEELGEGVHIKDGYSISFWGDV